MEGTGKDSKQCPDQREQLEEYKQEFKNYGRVRLLSFAQSYRDLIAQDLLSKDWKIWDAEERWENEEAIKAHTLKLKAVEELLTAEHVSA
jgi:hypothetical protein